MAAKKTTQISDQQVLRIDVADLPSGHPQIRAKDWTCPLVLRLLADTSYSDGSGRIEDSFRRMGSESPVDSAVELRWIGLEEECEQVRRTYQAPVITEMATLGLACVLMSKRAGLQITEVTKRRDKADYWIGDKEYLLEVSGEQSGNLADLCKRKAKQLLANPFGKPGFVCVAIYDRAGARLWFYEEEEKD